MLRLQPKESAVGRFVALNQQIGELGKEVQRRRRAEEEARRQEERLRVTLHSIGDAVIATDAGGRVSFMNPVAEAMTGWARADAVGMPLEVVFRIVNETTRQPVENPALRALAEGVVVGLANHTVLIARDGTERAIDDSAAPIRDGDGFSGAVLVFRDVTARRLIDLNLALNEQRLRMALEAAQMVAWEWSPADGWLNIYENAADVVGLPRGTTLVGIEQGLSLVHPDDLATYRVTYQKAIDERGGYVLHYRLIRPDDGRVLWMEERGLAVCDGSGRVERVVGVVMDITERRRAEDRLRDALSRLGSILSAGEVGTWEFDVVNNVVRADPNLARMFGVGSEVAAGGPIEDYTGAIHPDDRGRVFQAIRLALESGEGYEEEYRLVSPGQADRWVVARGRVERDEAGLAVRLPGVVVDITGRKYAEERHRQSESRFRTLFESMDEGFGVIEMISDPEGRPIDYRFLEMNPAFEHQTGLRGVVGRTVREVAPDHESSWFETYGRVAATGEPVRFVSEAKALGGRWFDVYAFRLGEAGSRKVAVLFSDISARIRAEAERDRLEADLRRVAADLSEADRRKDEFLATLAHELRNPLAPIRNGLQIMRVAVDDRQAVDESRSLMERQVTHMVRLIDDLMDISRITRNKLALRRERVELAEVVRNAVETSRPLVEDAGHELSVTMPARPIFVDADVTRLSQVFSNLLNNAAKYTEKGGNIALVVERQGGDVVVTVRDDGVGIPPEMLPRLFEMFTQVDRALERSQGGLGIGLSLVKTLVEMHGGSVEASSEGEGLGSEFVVRLPVVLAASARSESPDSDQRTNRPMPTLRILVVDDNVDSARTLIRLLKLMGHEARTAHDGSQAVEAAEEYRPDLMLLDIGLPVMNGYEVARAIRRRPWGRDPVIVALTGWGQEDDRRRSKEAGIDDHLVKPMDPATLESLLAGMRPGSHEDPGPATI